MGIVTLILYISVISIGSTIQFLLSYYRRVTDHGKLKIFQAIVIDGYPGYMKELLYHCNGQMTPIEYSNLMLQFINCI